MTTSLLVRSLQQLSAKELRALLDYVRCPLFNRRAEVIRLCAYLVAHIGKPPQKAFSAERMFAAACPGEAYENRRLRHIMSYLLEDLRQYLALMEWQSDADDQQRSLVRALRSRGLDKLFDKAVNKVELLGEREPLRDARHHFHQYELHQEKSALTTRHQRSGSPDPLPDELTAFYVAEMLRHACSAQMQHTAAETPSMQLLDAILDEAEETEMLHTPAVAVYYAAYRMLQSPEENEPFEQLKSLLGEHESRFGQEEMRGLYRMAIHGCIQRMNAGKRAFIREAFELYRQALTRNFLIENGFLSIFTYKNITRIASALGEQNWAEEFVEAQRPALHPRERDNAYRYNRAFLFFQNGDYAHALPLLEQATLEDPLNELHARRMQLRCYYELGKNEAIRKMTPRLAGYLKRQKNLGNHRLLNLHFLHFVGQLLQLEPGDPAAKAALMQEIREEKQVADREWLLSV